MSQTQQSTLPVRRTSQRRRQKLLRARDSFKAPNPFRLAQRLPLPEELAKHLRKIEYLTSQSIAQMTFGRKLMESVGGENMLDQMQEAIHLQEERFSTLLGSPITATQDKQEHWPECTVIQPQEVVQTKDQISRNIFSPRDPRGQEELPCDQLLVILPHLPRTHAVEQAPAAMLQEQVSHYFAD